MRALRPDAQIESFEIVSYRTAESQQKLLAQINGADAIIAPYLGPEWGVMSSESLRSKGFKVHPFLGVAFSGYHPDTIYIVVPSGHLQGAVGPYHSRIAVAGFLAGLSVGETVDLYNALAFSRLGYFDAFQQARLFLIKSFSSAGVDLAPYVDAWAAKGCFMHSLNHPKIHVLCDLALIACELIGLEAPDERAHLEFIPDNLSQHVQMPVYPEIASRLGVPGQTMFKTSKDSRNFEFLSLSEYVSFCFNVYQANSREHLTKADGVLNAIEKLGLEPKVYERIAS